MCVAEWILLIFITFIVIDIVFLTTYCHLEKCLDARRINRNMEAEAGVDKYVRNSEKQVSFSKRLFGYLEPYFYGWMRYSTIMVGKLPSHRLRNILMHYVFAMQITKNTVIYGGCEIRSPWNIKADKCVISTYCILDGRNGIEFGQNVVLGGGVHIWTEEHNVNDEYFRVLNENKQEVLIGDRAWICSDSTILPGVRVGEGAVIASRAVLTKNAQNYGVYAGVPAKKINKRNEKLKYELNGKPTWHFY